MKKLIMTIAIVLGMGMASFAQEEVTFEERGLFGKGVDGAKGGLFGLVPPQEDIYGDDNQEAEEPAPLGSGIAVLTALGAAYLVGKRRKEE